MKDYQLAWRNLWRNRKRTLITSASVFFAVFFALLMRSFQLGAYDAMFRNVIEAYTGYLQLQNTDYFDEPVLDNAFQIDPAISATILADPNVSDMVPRLESFALAAAGSRTQGVMVMGIDPGGEEKISGISDRLVRYKLTPDAISALKNEAIPERTKKLLDVFSNESYASDGRLILDLGISTEDTVSLFPVMRRHASFRNSFFSTADSGSVIIGTGLSEFLLASVGDTIVLMGQGYHGTTAAGKYVVKGIVKLPTPDIDNVIVYIPLKAAMELYAAEGMATSAVIRLKDTRDGAVQQTYERLNKTVRDPFAVRSWKELNALLINQIDADNKSGMIMIAILYLVIAFGVFGTVLMMMAERRKEFGMLVSIGMQKRKLAGVVSLELLLVGLLGVAAGVIASLPFVIYGNVHPLRFRGQMARMYEDYGFDPVMPTMMPDTYYLWQVVVVLIILLIALFFCSRKIFKINVISSLRN